MRVIRYDDVKLLLMATLATIIISIAQTIVLVGDLSIAENRVHVCGLITSLKILVYFTADCE